MGKKKKRPLAHITYYVNKFDAICGQINANTLSQPYSASDSISWIRSELSLIGFRPCHKCLHIHKLNLTEVNDGR